MLTTTVLIRCTAECGITMHKTLKNKATEKKYTCCYLWTYGYDGNQNR